MSRSQDRKLAYWAMFNDSIGTERLEFAVLSWLYLILEDRESSVAVRRSIFFRFINRPDHF